MSSNLVQSSSSTMPSVSMIPTTNTPPVAAAAAAAAAAVAAVATPASSRPKTFMEKQPYIVSYGAAISLFSPVATAYQLCRLYNVKTTTPIQLLSLSAMIFPHQTLLKTTQMNISTPVKEYLNPWAAFAVVGILQGGVYGQANVYFSKALHIGSKTVSLAGIFRGSGFAACRDMLSQGLPFMYSHHVRTQVLDRYYPTTSTSANKQDDEMINSMKHWTSVLSTSIVATYASQGVHNCSIAMQSNQTLGYVSAIKSVFTQHGLAMLYRGAEARAGLLLLVNVLNELLLKPAWTPVPILEDSENDDAISTTVLATSSTAPQTRSSTNHDTTSKVSQRAMYYDTI